MPHIECSSWLYIYNNYVHTLVTVPVPPSAAIAEAPITEAPVAPATASEPARKKLKRSSSTHLSIINHNNTTPNHKHVQHLSAFDNAVFQIKLAWTKCYGGLFPGEIVVLKDRSLVELGPALHEKQKEQDEQQQHTKTTVYTTCTQGTYNQSNQVVISKKELANYQRDRVFVKALKKGVCHQKCELRSQHTKMLTAAFAVSHPQVVPNNIQLLLSLGRYTLLHDVQGALDHSNDWITLKNVAQSSPKATAIDTWVKELASLQVIVHRNMVSSGASFFQTDGGHKGQEVSLFSTYCTTQERIIQVWAGCNTVAGKTSFDVAVGAKLRLELFFTKPALLLSPQVDGICVDSGQGTPESLSKEMHKLGLLTAFFCCDSCGLHDVQSVFRYAILICIGAGGLDSDDAIQLLHTLFSFYVEVRSFWTDLIKEVAQKLDMDISKLPRELNCSMQCPLLTRWWSISVLATLFTKHYEIYVAMCRMCVNTTKTSEKINVIASNLLRMFKEPWVVADVHFITAVSDMWMNRHLKWYQGKDDNIGSNGYLSVHRSVRYFIQLRDLQIMKDEWKDRTEFGPYRTEYNKLSAEVKEKKNDQRDYFFELMSMQIS